MHFFSSYKKSILLASTFSVAVSLAGCGGSNSGTGEIKTGIFVDSPVEGLTYVSGKTTGKTDAAGTYKYEDGQAVTFKVGDISLATIYPKALVTPVDLVTGAVDETNATVTNIAIFLQTIDYDSDPTNGIQISAQADAAAKGKVMSFTVPTATYTTDTSIRAIFDAITATSKAGVHDLVTDVNAQSQLRSALLARFIGNYEGTYTGGAAGSFSLSVDAAGTVTGSGKTGSADTYAITGTVVSKGVITFTGANGIAFTGTIVPDTGAMTGTLTLTSPSGAGNFTGTKKK